MAPASAMPRCCWLADQGFRRRHPVSCSATIPWAMERWPGPGRWRASNGKWFRCCANWWAEVSACSSAGRAGPCRFGLCVPCPACRGCHGTRLDNVPGPVPYLACRCDPRGRLGGAAGSGWCRGHLRRIGHRLGRPADPYQRTCGAPASLAHFRNRWPAPAWGWRWCRCRKGPATGSRRVRIFGGGAG